MDAEEVMKSRTIHGVNFLGRRVTELTKIGLTRRNATAVLFVRGLKIFGFFDGSRFGGSSFSTCSFLPINIIKISMI